MNETKHEVEEAKHDAEETKHKIDEELKEREKTDIIDMVRKIRESDTVKAAEQLHLEWEQREEYQ